MRKPLLAISDADLMAHLPDPSGEARESVRITAAASDELELEIYDILWPWESKRVISALKQSKAKRIHLRINSPGGDAFGGVAIYNALVRHPARVLSSVDGVAASAASVAAMAGDEIEMGKGTFLMIHEPAVFTGGTAKTLRNTADLLDKVGGGLAEIYSARSGQSEREVLAMMEKETWLNADDAIEKGFADTKADREAVEASFDLSIYAHAPPELAQRGRRRAPATVREFESFLRDEGGFSHSAARAIAAAGYKGSPEPRDEDGSGLLESIQAQLARTRLAAALHR